jgi:hypothetical protein
MASAKQNRKILVHGMKMTARLKAKSEKISDSAMPYAQTKFVNGPLVTAG